MLQFDIQSIKKKRNEPNKNSQILQNRPTYWSMSAFAKSRILLNEFS